ncbi:MAG TPA: hypothetical protein DCZ71_07735, partial [Ruminococcus sp.]|nr:hypothetical protein [Ruminococcus sp.]
TPGHGTEPVQGWKLGDVNRDGIVDSADASELLKNYASVSTGGDPIDEETLKISDVNFDGLADSSDASRILEYYSFISTGGNMTSDEFFKKSE